MSGFNVYLLAAGRGRRAGGPKAWLTHEGMPLLEKQVRFLLGRCAPARVAVTVQEEWLPRCRAELHAEVRWTAVDPDAQPLRSLQALLAAAPVTGWTFLYHVDMPVWDDRLFDQLQERVPEAEAAGAEAVVPVKDGRGGHPILLSPDACGALGALDPDNDRLDYWLRNRRVDRAAVPFAAIHENWNQGSVTPQ
ncbi:MAG: nucleotidyltransferase family protein [Elusimicrobiota bacterium]